MMDRPWRQQKCGIFVHMQVQALCADGQDCDTDTITWYCASLIDTSDHRLNFSPPLQASFGAQQRIIYNFSKNRLGSRRGIAGMLQTGTKQSFSFRRFSPLPTVRAASFTNDYAIWRQLLCFCLHKPSVKGARPFLYFILSLLILS